MAPALRGSSPLNRPIKKLELWYEKSVTIFSFLGLKWLKSQGSIPFYKEFDIFLVSFLKHKSNHQFRGLHFQIKENGFKQWTHSQEKILSNGKIGLEKIYLYKVKYYTLGAIGTNDYIISMYPIEGGK